MASRVVAAHSALISLRGRLAPSTSLAYRLRCLLPASAPQREPELAPELAQALAGLARAAAEEDWRFPREGLPLLLLLRV